MSGFRLKLRTGVGLRLTDEQPVSFTFDGKTYQGRTGDTLASALMANGVTTVARSFKYHRPRGTFTAGSEEPSALVTLHEGSRREPNMRATEVPLREGLVARGQNAWPSVTYDFAAINQLGGKAFSAGFYYKTFMGPRLTGHRATKVWFAFEQFIRRAAGLGSGSKEPDPDRYGRMNAFCDVLVVGSGAAGLSAARRAADAGARVVLVDENPDMGGALRSAPDVIDNVPAPDWAAAEIAALAAMENVTLLTHTTVQSMFDDGTYLAIERVEEKQPNNGHAPRLRAWSIVAKAAVIATGALERPLVFAGNDRPGVMLADAARRYAVDYSVAPGKAVAVFTNNDTGWLAARDMAKAGVIITAIIDVRSDVADAIRKAGDETRAQILTGSAVLQTAGFAGLSGVDVVDFQESSRTVGTKKTRIACDCLAVSGGWSPTFHLTSQQGEKPVWDAELQAFLPGKATTNWHGCGAMAGAFGLQAALTTGCEAADAALKSIGMAASTQAQLPDVDGDIADHAPAPVFEIKSKGKAFVDLQHDVTADDVRLAHREGYVSVEHLKRYTTLGMATDQGKTSNVLGLSIMAEARDRPIPDVGTTRFRPPYTPTAIGALAGELYGHLKSERQTPMHDWHLANRAGMVANGPWMRPESYNAPGETVEQAYIREAKAVRKSVGLVDVSTLGKIDVQGPDAAEFLNRIYSNGFAKLPVGKARYGLMLREDGFLFDDGTTWRLDDHRFLVTTTTAGAGKVMEHLEYHAEIVWPELKVALTSVSDEWAGVAVAGPKARALLENCVKDCDVSNEGLPFMGVRDAVIDGIPVLIARLSFSGELAYEVYCGAQFGQAIWDALMEAGKPLDVVPYGLEALSTLRIEKGHVAGPELNGRTTAHDLGLGGMVSTKKPFV
ncbi:MAG: sarcosine oxidase subunit alpha family protein, partial [Pseudomonadota bacterium]